MKKLIPGICLLLFATLAFSQKEKPESYCGYHGISDWLVEYQKNPDAYPAQRKGAILYIPMTVHILGDDDGGGYFGETPLLDAFCTLNADFGDSEIQFYLANDFNYIDNSSWFEHDFRNGRDMMNQNNFDNTVNTYFVGDPAGNCGYYTGGADALAVAKSCSGATDHTWSHEVGHYLSLPHPFVGWEGTDVNSSEPAPATLGNRPVERVDGSNCNQAADGFCDTEPDYISNRWSCNNDGRSQRLLDPAGTSFRADGSLIMGYSNDDCANRFTAEQIAAKHANINDERQDLLTNPTPLDAVESGAELVPISPKNGGIVLPGDITLTWEPIKNATRYVVEIYGLPTLNPLIVRKVVSGNTAVISDITRERPHYWRVRPFNEFHFCTDFTGVQSFVVSSALSTNYINGVETFSVAPIPAESGSEISIEISSKNAFEGNAKLVNLTGQILSNKKYQINSGTQNLRFDLLNVPQGIYLLSLENEEGERLVKKVVVN